MFYGPIEENQRLIAPISPSIRGRFEIVRNNFNEWLRVWKMRVTNNNKDLFKFFQKTKKSFINVCTNEVDTLKSVKIQFCLHVRFYTIQDEKLQQMDHYFNRMQLKPPPVGSRGRVGDLTLTPVKRHQYPYPLRLEFRSNAPTPEATKMKITKFHTSLLIYWSVLKIFGLCKRSKNNQGMQTGRVQKLLSCVVVTVMC